MNTVSTRLPARLTTATPTVLAWNCVRPTNRWYGILPRTLSATMPGCAAARPATVNLSIFMKCTLGSWRRKPDGGWYAYEELAAPLADYLRRNGYNYVEFLPLAEHPCDESWGYQVTGFFAPTSRYGDAAGLMALVDALHAAGIGVILDFVPAHFAVDAYGLAKFDGSCLYEYPPGADVGVSEWGSCNFMHSRGEVRSFLQSAARYWLETFHFDGLRFDAISRILYWQGEEAPRRQPERRAVFAVYERRSAQILPRLPACGRGFNPVRRRDQTGGRGRARL